MKKSKTLWLYLEPYTFISEDYECYYLYNSNSNMGLSFDKCKEINQVVRKLQDSTELYCVSINANDLNNDNLFSFIKNIQTFEFGDIIEGELPRPTIIPPTLNLQKSVERLKKHNIPIGSNIMSYLHEVAIFITGECFHNCKGCKSEFKQHICCTKFKSVINISLLEKFLLSLSHRSISITIIGGDIFKYKYFANLIEILKSASFSFVTFVSNWRNIPDNSDILSLISYEKFRLKVILDNPYQTNIALALSEKINKNDITQLWDISITSIDEYEKAEILSKQFECLNINTNIKPFYNNDNIDFFEENVYINTEELDAIKLDRQDIFALQELNTNDFGKIFVLPDGTIYANLNDKSIGNIKEPIGEILSKELESGISWRRTRYNTEPCKQCRFKLVCPSPSNYELVIGKMNLCHINM